jgi:hypothetical protein
MRSLVVLVLFTTPALADDVPVPGAPAIELSPGGLDPDVTARFDDADGLVRAGELPRALERVLVLYRAGDVFSQASREPAKPRAFALLSTIGNTARARGDLVLAAQAFDARWTLAGGRDHDAATTLAAWAERERDVSKGRALYLARRARAADPDLGRAKDLDEELSTNRRALPMKLVIVAGLAAFGAGLYADDQGHDSLATGLYVASPLLCASAILLGLSGIPNHSPVSPVELPSVGAGAR